MSKQSFLALAERFLGMMRDERGASEHTLRAYSREVRGFAEFLTETLGEGAAMARSSIRIFARIWGRCWIRG